MGDNKSGWKKGAMGIDGNDGEGFHEEYVDEKAVKAMYGQCWYGEDGLTEHLHGSGPTHGHSLGGGDMKGKKIAHSAVGGMRKIGGHGGGGRLGVHK